MNMNSAEQPMSPHQYRSLDSLTRCADSEIPEPGELKNVSPSNDSLPASTCSNPNLSGASHPSSTSSPVNNPAATRSLCYKLKIIQGLVKDALNLVDTDPVPSPQLREDISQIKRAAEPLPVIKLPKKLSIPIERSSARAASCPNLPTAGNTIPARPRIKTTAAANKPLGNISPAVGASAKMAIKPSTASVRNNKYSHVQSTIPKRTAEK